MTAGSKPHALIIIALSLALLVLAAPQAQAQTPECTRLEKKAAGKLEAYLEKRLAYELTARTIALIEDWRTEYGDASLMNPAWTKAGNTVAEEGQASELAEIAYLAAADAFKTDCGGG